jgi:hypothetical protein
MYDRALADLPSASGLYQPQVRLVSRFQPAAGRSRLEVRVPDLARHGASSNTWVQYGSNIRGETPRNNRGRKFVILLIFMTLVRTSWRLLKRLRVPVTAETRVRVP